jgi:hypothetical protein
MRGRKKLNLTTQEIDIRQEKRTIQNRINKRNQRIRIKMKEIISSSLSKMEHEEEYISNLINYFNTYEFDTHFTGTFDPKYSKKISLQSLKSYTDKFIQLLINEGIIEYGLMFLDTGENENTHTHILIKTNSNMNKIHDLIKSKWLLGTNVCSKIIETENHKLNTIKYGFNKTRGNTHSTRKTLWNLIKK